MPIELSDSPHFDVRDLKLINWLCEMLRSGRIKSLMAEPVCTTFSPAAHPAVRSYSEPKGFDRKCQKTLQGNIVAFRCLFLVWYAAICGRPSMLEQPRLSKMAWLSIWTFLLQHCGFFEAIVASCQFGPIHRKEFRMLTWGIDVEQLQAKCPGGHDHVRIQGAYTKDSAMYVPALAEHFARAFEIALRRKRHEDSNTMRVQGLESVVVNDLLMSGCWELEFAWHWRAPSHINILESHAHLAVLKKLTVGGGDTRFTNLLDSKVAKCSHAKGRSSSKALAPSLKKGAAWQIAGGLYPALNFAPTRLNTADGPSRGREIIDTSAICLCDILSLDQMRKLHSTNLSRVAASWIRLVLLVSCVYGSASESVPISKSLSSSQVHVPRSLDGIAPIGLFANGLSADLLAIGALLGILLGLFAGFGLLPTCISLPRRKQESRRLDTPSLCHFGLLILLWICLLDSAWIFSPPQVGDLFVDLSSLGSASHVWIIGIVLNTNRIKATYHVPQLLPLTLLNSHALAMPMFPAGTDEATRAARRASVQIAADRAVKPQTRGRRQVLLDQFDEWLRAKASTSLTELIDQKDVDAEHVSNLLVEYGKELFYAGKSYGRFSETINGINAKRPLLKRQLASAWNLAFAWVADEPHFHHPAMPLTILISFVTLSLLWGWPREASLLMMAWAGLLRIGEVFAARRRDLILPNDGAPGCDYAMLQIQQPKTRGVSAKHQAARIDPIDAVQLLVAVYRHFGLDDFLWNKSPGTFRRRFAVLQKALGLPTVRTETVVPYDLASLRPGGATFLLHRFEDAELVRRRGRWLSARVCEIYLQEAAVVTHAARLSSGVQNRISKLVAAYPEVHRKSIYFLDTADCMAKTLVTSLSG